MTSVEEKGTAALVVDRSTWTDHRLCPPLTFETLHAEGRDGDGALPPVYIAPGDPTENVWGRLCEVGECRVTRDELREWAEVILRTLATS